MLAAQLQRLVTNHVGFFQTFGEAHCQLVGDRRINVRHQRHKFIATGATDYIAASAGSSSVVRLQCAVAGHQSRAHTGH